MLTEREIINYRDNTKGHAKMRGVMSPSFKFRVCGQCKPTPGRVPMVPGYGKAGYKCRECAG